MESNDSLLAASPGVPRPGRDAVVLRALVEPHTLGELTKLSGIPRSSVHRTIQKLIKGGLVVADAGFYKVTPLGKTRANADGSPVDERDRTLEARWPFLRLFPTPEHRALAELILYARIARRDSLSDDRHPGFILVGRTQRLKSTLIKALCYLVGSSPKKCCVSMPQVRGRGLLTRLDAHGKKTYEFKAIAEPLVWFEEFSLADSGIRRDLEAILHGLKDVPVENETVTVQGVPVVELNARSPDGPLEKMIGLDIPRLRRCIVCDFTNVTVTAKMRTESPSVLKEIQTAGPADLPVASAEPLEVGTQALVDRLFQGCIRPEFMDFVDSSRLLTLISAARALLPERVAAQRVCEAYFVVASTTGFVYPDWRARFASIVADSSTPAVPATSTPEPQVLAAIGTPVPIPKREMNPYSLDEVLARLLHQVETAGFSLPEDSEELGDLLSVIRALDAEDVSPAELLEAIKSAGAIRELRNIIANYGGNENRIREVHELGLWLEGKNLKLEDVKAFLNFHLKLEALGFDYDLAFAIAQAATIARNKGDSDKCVADRLLVLARENLQLQDHTARLKREKHALEAEIDDLEGDKDAELEEVREHRKEKANLQATKIALGREVKDLEGQLKTLQGERNALEKTCGEKQKAIAFLCRRLNDLKSANFAVWGTWQALFTSSVAGHPAMLSVLQRLAVLRQTVDPDPGAVAGAVRELTSIAKEHFDVKKFPASEVIQKLSTLKRTELRLQALEGMVTDKLGELNQLKAAIEAQKVEIAKKAEVEPVPADPAEPAAEGTPAEVAGGR